MSGASSLAIAAVLVALTGSAAAGEADPAPRLAPTPPLRLIVSGDMPRILERGALRDRLAAELRAPVVLDADLGSAPDGGVVSVSCDAAAGALSVAYAPAAGPRVIRTIATSDRSGEAADLAVLLAGNLARDQAAELLAEARPAPSFAADNAREPAGAPSNDSTVLSRWTDAARPALRHLETEAWTSSLSLANVGARLAGRHLYALVNVAAHLEDWRPLAGAGLSLGVARACFGLECGIDLGTTYLYGGDGPNGYTLNRLISRARAHVAASPRPGLTLLAGGGYALTTHLHHVPDNVSQLELFVGVRL
jgi:hypothetical protein